jgi:hypothetical protein
MMKRENDNLSNNDSATQLDKNFSRLLKLTGKSNKPGRIFTESLIENALNELNQTDVEKSEVRKISIRPNWLKEVVGWAAMIAAAFGTGLVIVISVVLKMNLLLEVIVVLTFVFNWISSLGGHV